MAKNSRGYGGLIKVAIAIIVIMLLIKIMSRSEYYDDPLLAGGPAPSSTDEGALRIVPAEFRPITAAAPVTAMRPAVSRLSMLEKKLAQAKAAGNQKRIKRLNRRIANFRSRNKVSTYCAACTF
jgi:hypothetical protein